MATHSSILAWRTPRTEDPGGLQSTGSQRVGQDCATSTHTDGHSLSKSTLRSVFLSSYIHGVIYITYRREYTLCLFQWKVLESHVPKGALMGV